MYLCFYIYILHTHTHYKDNCLINSASGSSSFCSSNLNSWAKRIKWIKRVFKWASKPSATIWWAWAWYICAKIWKKYLKFFLMSDWKSLGKAVPVFFFLKKNKSINKIKINSFFLSFFLWLFTQGLKIINSNSKNNNKYRIDSVYEAAYYRI